MSKGVAEIQRGLADLGYAPGAADGLFGPRTEGAARAWLAARGAPAQPVEPAPLPIAASWRVFDGGDKISGLHPKLLAVLKLAAQRSEVGFDVIEGLRSKERQAALVKAGASRTLNSRHLTGHAADLWPIDPATGKRAANNDALLWRLLRIIAAAVKAAAKELGVMIEWGGDWGWDAPHFQLNRKAFP